MVLLRSKQSYCVRAAQSRLHVHFNYTGPEFLAIDTTSKTWHQAAQPYVPTTPPSVCFVHFLRLNCKLSPNSLSAAPTYSYSESNNEYSWDPISFAFTAPIGVAAAMLTLLTVWQGILSAGPGRFRARPGAIGAFAKFGESKFSFRELRRLTFAYVPILNEPLWYQGQILQARDHSNLYGLEETTEETTAPDDRYGSCKSPSFWIL